MLQDELSNHIGKRNLYMLEGTHNAYLLLQKEGFLRLYYYLNDFEESFAFDMDQPVVQELIYRGEKRFPQNEVNYWEKNGFRQHIGRDNYFLNGNSVNLESLHVESPEHIRLSVIHQEEHLKASYDMIVAYLDAYTGDILTIEELRAYAKKEELFGLFVGNQLAGILQAELKNNVYWLGHMVVKAEFRGQKLSTLLLKDYFKRGLALNCRQFQLWVINNNEAALALYKKYGFKYLNKSTISLLNSNG